MSIARPGEAKESDVTPEEHEGVNQHSNAAVSNQQTRYIDPMLGECWGDVRDGGPTITQHWVNVSCWLG